MAEWFSKFDHRRRERGMELVYRGHRLMGPLRTFDENAPFSRFCFSSSRFVSTWVAPGIWAG